MYSWTKVSHCEWSTSLPRPQPLPANVVEHMSFEEQVQAAMDASIQLELHRRQQRDWRRRMPVIPRPRGI